MYDGGAIMAGGRPRTVSLPPDDMIKLGEEMIAWVKSHPEIVHLSQWWSVEKEYTDEQWDVMKDAPEFSPYYARALKLVGYKYLDKDSNVRSNISDRWQRVYFKVLRKSEDADMDAAADRSKKIAEVTVPPLDYVRELERKNMTLEHENLTLKNNANKPQAE